MLTVMPSLDNRARGRFVHAGLERHKAASLLKRMTNRPVFVIVHVREHFMFERYTEKARRTIFFARYEASQFGSPRIEAEHLLLGLLHESPPLPEGSQRPGALLVRHKELIRCRCS